MNKKVEKLLNEYIEIVKMRKQIKATDFEEKGSLSKYNKLMDKLVKIVIKIEEKYPEEIDMFCNLLLYPDSDVRTTVAGRILNNDYPMDWQEKAAEEFRHAMYDCLPAEKMIIESVLNAWEEKNKTDVCKIFISDAVKAEELYWGQVLDDGTNHSKKIVDLDLDMKNDNVKTELESIKNALAKPAVIFETGGKRPTKELMESWIGRVGWKTSGEELPEDQGGEPMVPVMTLFIKNLPSVPETMKHIELITVFISVTAIEECILEEGDFCVRTYDSLEALESCDWQTDYIKAFPLIPKSIEEDYPAWDSDDMPESIRNRILELENAGEIDYFEDIADDDDKCFHKIGGYPSYIQSGITWENYEFIFQIASDEKANFYFGDAGNIYFFYNKDEDRWGAHYDYY